MAQCHAGINIYREGLYIGLTVKCIDYFEHGMPIVNDPLYGIPEPGFRHMGLWACRLQTGNPFNTETITVTDRVPEDFRQFKTAVPL